MTCSVNKIFTEATNGLHYFTLCDIACVKESYMFFKLVNKNTAVSCRYYIVIHCDIHMPFTSVHILVLSKINAKLSDYIKRLFTLLLKEYDENAAEMRKHYALKQHHLPGPLASEMTMPDKKEAVSHLVNRYKSSTLYFMGAGWQ